jgi:hypothetical protein
MLIIGVTVVSRPLDSGMFFCPVCRETKSFQRQLQRRYLSLFTFSLIPLDIAADVVECGRCHRRFSAEVLRVDPLSRHRDFASHLRQMLLLLLAPRGQLNEPDLGLARDVYQRFTGEAWAEPDVRRTLQALDPDAPSPARYLERVVFHLGERDKDKLVQAAFLAATAPSASQEARRRELEQLPLALHISETRFRKLIEQALSHE